MIALRKHTVSNSRHATKTQEAIQSRCARSVRGETLTEVLVAILISCLAILMLATVIAASFNVNETSRKAMDRYYDDSNTIANRVNNNTPDGDGTVSMSYSGGTSVPVMLENNNVEYYINNELNNEAVVSFVVAVSEE